MKKNRTKNIGRSMLQALLLAALLAFAVPQFALANSGADATIVNVVQVDYTDATGTQSFSAHAAAKVTINLVESALTISGRPTGTAAGDTAGLPTPSGGSGTVTHLVALTATANGDDSYDLDITTNSPVDVANESVSWATVAADGTTEITGSNPASVTLGSSVISGVVDANSLEFPGGTLTDISIGDIVVINNVDYAVGNVTLGSAADHSYADGAAHGDTAGTATAEVKGQLDLIANASGSNTAVPDFTATPATYIGNLAAEQVLVLVSAYAETTASSGTLSTVITTDSVQDGTYTPGDNGSTDTVSTTFQGASLTITKEVSTDGGSTYAGTASGNPGATLTYRVTIANTASGDASNVVVTDVIPAYTTLNVDGSDNFATVTYGATIVNITTTDALTENGSAASGDAPGTAAGQTMTFYLGNGNDATAIPPKGGTLAGGESIEVIYEVTID